ncbi:MAG: hypothetical protein IID58_01210 [Proteobacteria bacterium]|nr:hypothetical protein [Pseudomonadota bacterium]
MTPRVAAMLLAMLPVAGQAAPGDILFSDNFNDATLAPWTTTDASRSGILTGPQVAQSGSGAYTRNDAVTVTSPIFNASVPAARLNIWIRRGDDAFSEDPDGGEDFYVEYQRADTSWGVLGSYLGSGTPGQIYTDSFNLPADALHGSLAVRVRQIAGSGFDWDYWHFDDVVVTETAVAPPLGIGSCDDFEGGLGNWTVNPTSGLGGISGATSSSPSNSLFLNGGVVNVVSNVIDTSDSSFSDLTMWIRRGADSFSEDPDGGENLVVEYLDDVGAWIALETFSGSGGPGQRFVRSYTLPAAGRHTNFQLRYRMIAGSGAPWDFWHVDDVCFDQDLVPDLLVSKVAQTLTDPINGSANPKAIPGAVIQYTLGVSNQGLGPVDADSLVITDPLPTDTALFVDTSGGDPITFVDGAVASGLTYTFATDVTFSKKAGGGPPYNYAPVPDAQGFDAVVTGFRINPGGAMNPTVGTNVPGFNILLRVRIQ